MTNHNGKEYFKKKNVHICVTESLFNLFWQKHNHTTHMVLILAFLTWNAPRTARWAGCHGYVDVCNWSPAGRMGMAIPHLHLCVWAPTAPQSVLRLCLPPPSAVHPCSPSYSPASCGPQSSPPPKALCPIYLHKTQALAQKLQMTPRLPSSVSLGSDTQESLFSLGASWEVGDRKGEVWVKSGAGSQCPVCGFALKLLFSVRLPSPSSHNVPSVPQSRHSGWLFPKTNLGKVQAFKLSDQSHSAGTL